MSIASTPVVGDCVSISFIVTVDSIQTVYEADSFIAGGTSWSSVTLFDEASIFAIGIADEMCMEGELNIVARTILWAWRISWRPGLVGWVDASSCDGETDASIAIGAIEGDSIVGIGGEDESVDEYDLEYV